MTKEERIQLLARAREAKAKKAQMLLANKIEEIEKGNHKNNNDDIKEIVAPKIKKTQEAKKKEKTLELKLPEPEPEVEIEVEEPEELEPKKTNPALIEQRIKIKAPTKKKIIKRIVEVEESDTEEEIIEEVVRIPRMKKEVKISRKMMLDKLQEQNRQRLMGELFN